MTKNTDYTIIPLKGGSLSATELHLAPSGKFVRKSCSLTENREYGYQRWYSQLKRLQRYNHQFPGFFPKVLRFGIDDGEAYFDMEYIENSITAFEYLCTENDAAKIKEFFTLLVMMMKVMHKEEMPSSPGAIVLYLSEEVLNKLRDAGLRNIKTTDGQFIINDEPVKPFDDIGFCAAFSKYAETTENFTHGNLTLENILYCPQDKKIVFIDPYEENIIDSKLCDYSQLLQSCNSHYELYNAGKLEIDRNRLNNKIEVPFGIAQFNVFLNKWLKENISPEQRKMVRLFEISQFIRMLPFKREIDSQKMVFFYALASKMFENYKL